MGILLAENDISCVPTSPLRRSIQPGSLLAERGKSPRSFQSSPNFTPFSPANVHAAHAKEFAVQRIFEKIGRENDSGSNQAVEDCFSLVLEGSSSPCSAYFPTRIIDLLVSKSNLVQLETKNLLQRDLSPNSGPSVNHGIFFPLQHFPCRGYSPSVEPY
jgi:hypothetical protein